ncbi:MAG: Do family serine endopeptidase [Cyclobacteriaceae bacterium]
MNKRNSILAMILSSFLGGVIAIGGYTIIQPENGNTVVPVNGDFQNPVSFTNYVFDSADFVVPDGLNFVYAAKSATPAVVHIRTTYSAEVSEFHNPIQEFFRDYYGGDSQPRQRERQGAGSGVIISEDGYIATNNHVVENASEIEVVLSDNRSFKGEIVGTDPDTDIALVKIDAKGLPTMALGNSESIQVGEWVLAIGNPFAFRSTVTAGIVSAKGRNIGILASRDRDTQIEAFIQTDAAVNPGNSGGALVNLKGELVGINTAIASPTGAFAGYSFAVPTTLVKKVVADLKDFGAVQRPLLGIRIQDMNASLAEEHNADVLRGVYVAGVNPNSAAEEAGIRQNDIIVAINEKPITNVAQLQEQVALNRPGDKISVTYVRNGKTYNTQAKLKNILNTTEMVTTTSSFEIEGAKITPVSKNLKEKLGIEGGVQITSLGEGKWKRAGIKEDFIITKIDKRDIRNPEDLTSALRIAKGEGILIEGLYPNGEKAYYGIGW